MNGDYAKDSLLRKLAAKHGFKIAFVHDYWSLHTKIEEVMVMGILRGTGDILKHAWANGKRTYYIDNGHFQGWDKQRRYRIGINSLFTLPAIDPPADRAERFLSWLHPTQSRPGNRVILCGQTQPFMQLCGYENWFEHGRKIANEKFPGCEIVVREKTTHNKGILLSVDRIEKLFDGARALITCGSSSAIKSVFSGIETIADERYVTKAFEGDHEKFKRQLAYCEYTDAEFESGIAKELAEYIAGH